MKELEQAEITLEILLKIHKRIMKFEEFMVQQFALEFDIETKSNEEVLKSLENINKYDTSTTLIDKTKKFLDMRIKVFTRRIETLKKELKDGTNSK